MIDDLVGETLCAAPPPPPALELPPLTKTQASVASQGFPLFCSFIQSLEAPAGFIPAAPPPPTRSFLWRAGTKLGLLPVRGDESKSPRKGSCQGNPEPLRCLTFICFFFLFTPNGAYPTELGGGAACMETQADMCGDKAVNLT